MKQELIFKYRPESLIELTEMNHLLTQKISISHNKVKDFPMTLQYLHNYEEEISLKAIKNNKTKFKEDDVEYHISSFGYREKKTIEEMSNLIGVWGCSYTFGVGVPDKDIFPIILEDKLKSSIYNFGIPGAGIQKISKSFIVNNNLFKFKTAFFVLPSLYRFEYISFNCYDTPKEVPIETVSSFDFIPNWFPKHNKEVSRKSKMLYEIYDDASFMVELVRNLELIKQNAEINGTKLYFTTWCDTTYNLLVKYEICDIEIVKFIENMEFFIGQTVNDFARDGLHPGIRSHQETANVLHDLYKGIKQDVKLI
jgi:hypothetical protein